MTEASFYTPFHAWLDALSHMESEYDLSNPPFEEDEEYDYFKQK